jgi:hypothetical protein
LGWCSPQLRPRCWLSRVIDLYTFEVAEVGFAELEVDDVVNSESFRSFGPNAGNLAGSAA